HYSIELEKITFADLYEFYRKIKIVPEPNIPFPQADNFYRVLDFLRLLYNSDHTKDELALNYEFDIHTERQYDYYINAARYLGLVDKYRDKESDEVLFRLTEKGRNIMSQSRKMRYLMVAESIMEHEVFYRAMGVYFTKKKLPVKKEVIDIMKDSRLIYDYNDSTIERRAQTVLKWLEWIVSLVE
ncbi:MAG: translation elongation factor, partial [Halanaerobiales bacterium]